MKNKVIKYSAIVLLFLVLGGIFNTLMAQCPMCRIGAESNMKNGGTLGNGLNAGILYMLVMPYLLVGCIAFWWWKNKKSDNEIVANQATEMLEEDDKVLN